LTPFQIGILGVVILVVLLALRVPAGVSLIIAAAVGGSLLTSPGMALTELGADIMRIASHYGLSVIPFFILTCVLLQCQGSVLPPVLALIMFAFLSGGSIGRVLIAGVLPGIIAVILLGLAVLIVRKFPHHPAPGRDSEVVLFRWGPLRDHLFIAVVFSACAGAIFEGVLNPTEAGALCAFVSTLFLAISRRMTAKNFLEALLRSVSSAAGIFVMIAGGSLFGAFLTRSLVSITLIRFVTGINVQPFLFIGLFLLIYVIAGMIMEYKAALAVVTPVLFPIAVDLGYSGVLFSVLAVMALMFGVLYKHRAKRRAEEATDLKPRVGWLLHSVLPLWAALLIVCIVTAVYPSVAVLLPRMMLSTP